MPAGHAAAARALSAGDILAVAPAADTVTSPPDLRRVIPDRTEHAGHALEPTSRDRELAPGLEARVHDPLWLLGRQWQFGEFAAADGGSAVVAELSGSAAPLSKLRLGRPVAAPRVCNYSMPAVPLETLVEAEDVRAAPSVRMRVRAGQHFERLLAARGLGRYAPPP